MKRDYKQEPCKVYLGSKEEPCLECGWSFNAYKSKKSGKKHK